MKKRLFLIFAAFCVSFVAMVALSLFSIGRFTTLTAFSDQVDHSNKVINVLYKTEVILKDLDRWERGYILTNDTVYVRAIGLAIDSLRPSADELEQLTRDNKQQQNNITMLKSNIALRINFARSDLDYIDTSHSKLASPYYYEGRKVMIEANRKMKEMHTVENDLLAERYKQEQTYQRITTSSVKSLLLVFCLITLVSFTILIRLIWSRARNQEELQARVIDLRRSHAELEEIAYVASHDLQEPLRKIQVFSNMLLYQKKNELDAQWNSILERINTSAGEMQLLITDLTHLTNLTKTEEQKTAINLNRILQYIFIDISEKVKDAVVNAYPLPEIKGYSDQIKILFTAILDNALKFSKEGVQPIITITGETVRGTELAGINPNLKQREFQCITISDNGIGFDNKYINKIFQIFQRLHTQESQYDGKGIGLAICQRIMANHEGYIIANGTPGEGAKFKLFFPIEL